MKQKDEAVLLLAKLVNRLIDECKELSERVKILEGKLK